MQETAQLHSRSLVWKHTKTHSDYFVIYRQIDSSLAISLDLETAQAEFCLWDVSTGRSQTGLRIQAFVLKIANECQEC